MISSLNVKNVEAGHIYYIDLHYNNQPIGILIEVKGVSKSDDSRIEVFPVAGDRSCFWIAKRDLYYKEQSR